MKRFLMVSPALLVLCFAAVPCGWSMPPPVSPPLQTAQADPPDQAILVQGNNAFALDLSAQLRGRPGNLFFSPYSLSNALGMTFAGARGQTAEELAKALHFTLGERTHPAFASVNRQLQAGVGTGAQLAVANALWGQQDYSFHQEFLRLALDNYQGGLGKVDFRGNSEGARRTINQWVARQTRDKIPELLGRGTLLPETRLVLTNAVYFKADWEKPFSKANTRDLPFQMTARDKVQTPMMQLTFNSRYDEADGIQVLDIPYHNGRWSFVLMLPREPDGLAKLEKTLTPAWLQARIAALRNCDVDLTLPRFRINDEFTLRDHLAELGAHLVFSPDADLTGISDQEPLLLSEVIHNSFVEVEEEGTEAAAAAFLLTGVGAAPDSEPPPPPVVVRADHPFLFLVRDNPTGTILFLGRVVDPRSR